MIVLGVSCDYHDAAASVVVDGEVAAAAEEERFTRIKHDSSLPVNATAAVLKTAGVDVDDIDLVAFHEKPLVVASRVLAARQRVGPRAVPTFISEAPTLLGQNLMIGHRIDSMLRRLGADRPPPIHYSSHHLSHAAAAFLPSPFETAAILTVDGIGEWSTASIGRGVNSTVDLIEEQRYPHSLGLLYSLATYWCGFQPNDGEYKLMGLAPYGEPTFLEQLGELVEIHDDGSLTVDAAGVRWFRNQDRMGAVEAALDGPPLAQGARQGDREADIARSVQALTETVIQRMARHAVELTGERSICIGGGVALNCVANGHLLRSGIVDDVWIQPAAGDAGSAIGAALWCACGNGDPRGTRTVADDGRRTDGMSGSLLGPWFSTDEICAWLDGEGVEHRRVDDPGLLCDEVSRRLADGAIVGWFQGRMEFGPRALGNRSILADPRSTTVQREINVRVKGRESFRPFAPAVLAERAAGWFEIDGASPYMVLTFDVASQRRVPVDAEPQDPLERVQVPRSEIPACTHVDLSARVQTVHRAVNPRFHQLLSSFEALTGCPVLLNTSFNVAGEPIVCTPDDALRTARAAGMDLLVLQDCIVELDGGVEGG